MIRLAARSGRCGAPRSRATEVSGSSTGGVATLGWGAVAHSPLNGDAGEAERAQEHGGQRTGQAGCARAPG